MDVFICWNFLCTGGKTLGTNGLDFPLKAQSESHSYEEHWILFLIEAMLRNSKKESLSYKVIFIYKVLNHMD